MLAESVDTPRIEARFREPPAENAATCSQIYHAATLESLGTEALDELACCRFGDHTEMLMVHTS